MSFAPSLKDLLARARGDLRMGLGVVLQADGAGALVHAVECLTPDRLAEVLALPGTTTLALTARRAETLKARAYDGDLARIPLPRDTTLRWLAALADPADDLRVPMKGPLGALRDAPGADLARLGLALAKGAQILPAVILTDLPDSEDFASRHALTRLPAPLAQPLLEAMPRPAPVIHAALPTEAASAGRLHVFRLDDGGPEHYAFEIGQPDRATPVLARLHSACFTGDVLGSLKCDCGPQLRGALAQMGQAGAGVLLYLNQEGRGIGLANKMRAYALQDQGFDTVEANHRLGFEDEERDFRIGATILARMGFTAVRLMTNNPRKIDILARHGMTVTERVPLILGEGRHNRDYLATKARKSGHLL